MRNATAKDDARTGRDAKQHVARVTVRDINHFVIGKESADEQEPNAMMAQRNRRAASSTTASAGSDFANVLHNVFPYRDAEVLPEGYDARFATSTFRGKTYHEVLR